MIQNSSELANDSTKSNPSEAKLRLIIDTIPVIAWGALADGSAEFWIGVARLHGIACRAYSGWGWRAAIHPGDLDRIEKKCRADLASGPPP
jgi:hypothetical protein